jgi:hypothetical protein
MDPKKMTDSSAELIFALAFLSACATMDANAQKVTSVVDPQRIDAVQELAAWKQNADMSARLASAGCESKYTIAQQQVNGWIQGPVTVQIDDMAAQYYGTVDLSKQRIPQQVSAAVGEFQNCADVGARGDIENMAQSVMNWARQQSQAQRKQSADALKAQLKTYQWASWSEAKKATPR